MCLFLHQLLLLPFKVHLLQGKKELAPLQNLVKVKGVQATDRKRKYPRMIVLPNSLGSVTLNIAFHARPSMLERLPGS
jgi:hypothetical protein